MPAKYNFSVVNSTLFVDGESQKCFVQKMYSFLCLRFNIDKLSVSVLTGSPHLVLCCSVN